MSLTVTDLFCGAGGSGLGAAAAGMDLVIAANHWERAIETHAANFPDTEHDLADISQVDVRRYPRTNVLWASPECTNHSQSKGVKRSIQHQPDLFGETLPDEAAVRSRATMWDVPRFAEQKHYDAIVVENVVEAARWVMWPAWLQAMTLLGYEHKTVWLNSMHAQAIDAPRAPQSRDRLYVVFWRKGIPAPDLEPRPLAWCEPCGEEVAAVQWWKKPNHRWGRYRAQYLYRCPNGDSVCQHSIVEPYALPAAAAIDWTLPGQRIGDRTKPLSEKTRARIAAGIERYWRPVHLAAHGNQYDAADPRHRQHGKHGAYMRVWPTDTEPLRTMQTTDTTGIAVPGSFIVERRGVYRTRPTDEPLSTVTANDTSKALVLTNNWNNRARPTTEPAPTITTATTHALVVPYYTNSHTARPADQPLPTVMTRDSAGVAFLDAEHSTTGNPADGARGILVRHNTPRGNPAQMCTPTTEPARTITTTGHQSLVTGHTLTVDDCYFRMLEPTEIQAAMAFHTTYQVLGTRREKVRQLGNGVTPPAAEWLLRRITDALNTTRATT